MPEVSVLIPCFNCEQTITDSLKSILRQTLTDIEVIVVDDGSSDLTLDILKITAEHDNRVKVIKQEHHGIIETLNRGLDACTSDLVARMDADDISLPTRLEKQVKFLRMNEDTGLVGCLVNFTKDSEVKGGFAAYIGWQNSLVTNQDVRREIFIESPFVHPSVVFRKSTVIELGGYIDHGWAEDYDLWLRMYNGGVKFAKIPGVLLHWREHPNRLTRIDSRYSLENFLRAKAHYLSLGALRDRDCVIIWGAGMTGRRLSKHLIRNGLPIVGFIDVDPKKIGRTLRGFPIWEVSNLLEIWNKHKNPALISAVGSRNARKKIKKHLISVGLVEAEDWWFVA